MHTCCSSCGERKPFQTMSRLGLRPRPPRPPSPALRLSGAKASYLQPAIALLRHGPAHASATAFGFPHCSLTNSLAWASPCLTIMDCRPCKPVEQGRDDNRQQ